MDKEHLASGPTPRPRMSDVATLAGVSVPTVSNFANGRFGRMSPETRARVQDAIEQLGYRVNISARGLRSSRTQTLAFLVLDDSPRFLADPLTGLYLSGIGDVARGNGYSVLVHSAPSTAGVAELFRPLMEMRAEAACVLLSGPRELRLEIVTQLIETGIEFVLLDESLPAEAGDVLTVKADQELGARKLVQYLLGRGHRRIAFIGGDAGWAVLDERFAGYREALRSGNLDFDESLCLFEAGWEPTGGAPIVAKLLGLETPPTAIVCGSDMLAIGVMRSLVDHGLRVPDDVAVCGFDDFDFSAHTDPQLTTVAVPAWQMGQTAAQILLDSLAGKPLRQRQVCLPTELRIRASA